MLTAALMAVQYPVIMSYCADKLGYNEVPFAKRGYTSQNEIFVALPVTRYGLEPRSLWRDASVEFALPFIAVDNSTSAFSGREMLGLPKLIGPLTFGESSFPGSFAAFVHKLAAGRHARFIGTGLIRIRSRRRGLCAHIDNPGKAHE